MTFNGTGNVVDGMINNWAEDGEPRQDLPEDAVEEFKVTNAGYKAEFGLATGGVVQVVTKSGTNSLRGTAFEYFRDKSLNARASSRAEKPDYRRHQFGGSAGGPIVARQGALLRRVRAHRHRGVLHGQHRPAAVLLVARGDVPAALDRNLYSARVDWQLSNAQSVFARYLRRGRKEDVPGLRRHQRVAAATRRSRASRWWPATPGCAAPDS